MINLVILVIKLLFIPKTNSMFKVNSIMILVVNCQPFIRLKIPVQPLADCLSVFHLNWS